MTKPIEECRPISRNKSWLLIERNGEAVERPRGFSPPAAAPHVDAPHKDAPHKDAPHEDAPHLDAAPMDQMPAHADTVAAEPASPSV